MGDSGDGNDDIRVHEEEVVGTFTAASHSHSDNEFHNEDNERTPPYWLTTSRMHALSLGQRTPHNHDEQYVMAVT